MAVRSDSSHKLQEVILLFTSGWYQWWIFVFVYGFINKIIYAESIVNLQAGRKY